MYVETLPAAQRLSVFGPPQGGPKLTRLPVPEFPVRMSISGYRNGALSNSSYTYKSPDRLLPAF